MSRTIEILNTLFIQKPVAEVFQYVTTAAHWVEWHPTTICAEGDVDHSGRPNDKILEKVRLGLLRGEILWTVKESQPPARWVFEGVVKILFLKGSVATITYHLSARNGGTHFERRLVYTPATPFATFLDRLFLERHNRRQSERALEQLKRAIEGK